MAAGPAGGGEGNDGAVREEATNEVDDVQLGVASESSSWKVQLELASLTGEAAREVRRGATAADRA